jgi:hypothetical protein
MTFDFTNTNVMIGALVVLLLIIVAIAFAVHERRKRTAELRRRFGAEYDLALREDRTRRKAEARLLARIKRVEHLKLRDLTATELDRFRAEWEAVQSRFIDHPRGAVAEADELVNSVMLARGFPVGRFEQRAADISVNHSSLVQSYRSANAITVRVGTNEATTEELRTAMIHYRALFDELLQIQSPAAQKTLV